MYNDFFLVQMIFFIEKDVYNEIVHLGIAKTLVTVTSTKLTLKWVGPNLKKKLNWRTLVLGFLNGCI